MSWIKKLYDTYEACESMVGNLSEKYSLLPICHTTQKAHIEIVIDNEGNYIKGRAHVIFKDDAQTIIPCTEESGSRSGQKPICHPLCDKLQYVAGDFIQFGGVVTKGYRKKPSEPFEDYIKLLSTWSNSIYKNDKIISIMKYVEKKSVMHDLVKDKVLLLNNENKLLYQWDGDKKAIPDIFTILPGKWNEKRQEWENWQAEAFVRWVVEKDDDPQSKVWTDNEIIKSWIDYYSSTKTNKYLCYVTGSEQNAAIFHPKKIRNDGDGAMCQQSCRGCQKFCVSGLFHKGTLSPKYKANWFRAIPQSRIGIVHFFEAFVNAKYNNFITASSVGKAALFFITLRRLKFKDSIAFVV